MRMPGRRAGFFLTSAACACAMGFALYAQYVMKLEPCPLCILQRVGVIAVGVISLLAGLHNPRGVGFRIWSVLVVLAAVAGGAGLSAANPAFYTCAGKGFDGKW